MGMRLLRREGEGRTRTAGDSMILVTFISRRLSAPTPPAVGSRTLQNRAAHPSSGCGWAPV